MWPMTELWENGHSGWRGSGAQVSLRHVCELVHFGGIKGAAGKPNS